MTFSEIAKILGIENYPSKMDELFANPNWQKPDVCDEELITKLQTEFNAFGDYYGEVIAAARQLANDPIRLAWAQTVAAYDLSSDLMDARKVLCPVTDGTLLGNMLPLFALLPMIPVSIADYRRRGFSEDIIRECTKVYGESIGIVERNTGFRGLNQLYFTWLCIYAKARIFPIAGYNFEIKRFPAWAFCLRNRDTGDIAVVAAKRTIHRSGLILDGAGCTDRDGAFDVDLIETEDAFIGYPAENNLFVNRQSIFPKAQWECILRPDDYMLNFHIPSGSDLTTSCVASSMRTGMEAVRKFYPEIPINVLACSSWLLNPILEDFLGANSKIVGFGKMFHRFPIGGGGRAGFSLIFPGKYENEKDLPENTTLQRAVKKHLLEGGNLLSYGGIYVIK